MNSIGGSYTRLLILALLIVGLSFAPLGGKVTASYYTDLLKKQEILRKQAEENKKALELKRREAGTLQEVISDLNSDISETQARIDVAEREIELTSQIIAQLSLDISVRDEKLGGAYGMLYELSRTNSSSMMFAEKINDQLSQAQYIQSIQSQLQGELKELGAARTQQELQKKSLEQLNAELTSSKDSLVSKKSRQNYLLALNADQQKEFESNLKKVQSEYAKVSDAVVRERERLLALENVNNSGTGGYAYSGWGMNAPDPWGFLTRQCTSYVAWKWNVVYGKRWLRGEGPPGTGDAKNWATILAPRNGYSTGSAPRTGSIIVWPAGPGIGQYGHVAVVERTYGNGNIDVSEYNFSPPMGGKYSYRTNINPRTWGNPTYIYQ
jgi:surface antigen